MNWNKLICKKPCVASSNRFFRTFKQKVCFLSLLSLFTITSQYMFQPNIVSELNWSELTCQKPGISFSNSNFRILMFDNDHLVVATSIKFVIITLDGYRHGLCFFAKWSSFSLKKHFQQWSPFLVKEEVNEHNFGRFQHTWVPRLFYAFKHHLAFKLTELSIFFWERHWSGLLTVLIDDYQFLLTCIEWFGHVFGGLEVAVV